MDWHCQGAGPVSYTHLYFKSKAFQLQPVPDGLDMDIAALGEPTACAMYSGLNTGVQLGDTVVIMGGGYAGPVSYTHLF